MRGLSLLAALVAALAFAGLVSVASVAAEPVSVSPREKYILFCAGCHGFDGEGGGGGGGTAPVSPLEPDIGVFLRDQAGRAYLVNVGGVSASGMTSAETATVLNYILREFGSQTLPDDFEAYTEAEVDALRKTPLDDPVATRKEIRSRLKTRGYTLPPYQWEG
jgi:mono/diheme cytochrome c family protein